MGRVMFDSNGRLVSADGVGVEKQKQEKIGSFEEYGEKAVRKDKLKISGELEFLKNYEKSVLSEDNKM